MNELYTPLSKREVNTASRLPWGIILVSLALLPLLVGAMLFVLSPKPLAPAPFSLVPFPQDVVKIAPPPALPANVPTISIIDGRTGQSQSVPLPQGLDVVQPLKIPVPPSSQVNTPPETLKPIEAFSAHFKPTLKQAGLPRVAIIMGGKELPQVFEKLPQATTLALPSLVENAVQLSELMRGRGFEVLLQLPPENLSKEAAPLIAGALPAANLSSLNTHLSRFTSYIGVFLPNSPKFIAHEASFSALLRETSKRGLVMVEDGSEPKSLTVQLSKALQAPALKVDVVLESGGSLAQRFLDLENIAKREGVAIGYLSASQAGLLSSWARSAESRGILFTPLSSLLARKGF